MNAYSELYLDDAMKNLGEAFDYAVNVRGFTPDGFMELFVSTGIAGLFGRGNPKYVSGYSGTELVLEISDRAGLAPYLREAKMEYGCSPEYWCGWILAYYQWNTGRTFRDIFANIKPSEILQLYLVLHEASEEKAIDVFEQRMSRKPKITKLQQKRKLSGYSQKELAERSGVNLRTLQQYETGAKDLSKASVRAVQALADILGCETGDLLPDQQG